MPDALHQMLFVHGGHVQRIVRNRFEIDNCKKEIGTSFFNGCDDLISVYVTHLGIPEITQWARKCWLLLQIKTNYKTRLNKI